MIRRTLLLGLGNDILTDDAVGLLVARAVAAQALPGVTVREASIAGFDLIELLAGYDRAVIIDAIRTSGGTPGELYRVTPADLPRPSRLGAVHEIGLVEALGLGAALGHAMPPDVVVIAIEALETETFGEQPTPAVAAAVPAAIAAVLAEIARE